MKKLYTIMLLAFLTSATTLNLIAKKESSKKSKKTTSNVQLFTAENQATGNYYPKKKTATLDEEKYIKVIAINKKDLKTLQAKKLKKNKMYLGSYIDTRSGKTFYLYGVAKNPAPVNDGPDADVLIVQAIEMDYGPGE